MQKEAYIIINRRTTRVCRQNIFAQNCSSTFLPSRICAKEKTRFHDKCKKEIGKDVCLPKVIAVYEIKLVK